VQPTHQPGEFAEPTLGEGPTDWENFRFQHDFSVSDVRQINGRARRELNRLATQTTGNRHFINAERSTIARTGDLDRMGAD
jgi:hypothetical protein